MAKNDKVKQVPSEGTPASQEINRPMAVRDITIEDKYEALEARVAVLEKKIDEHLRYHFGRRME